MNIFRKNQYRDVSDRLRALATSLGYCGKKLFFFAALSLLPFIQSCNLSKEETPLYRSWDEIKSSDTIRVGAISSPLIYFLYKGEELGPEYEKIVAFATRHDLNIELHLAPSSDSLFTWIERGEIDLSIAPYGMTAKARERVDFCGEKESYSIVLVQKQTDSLIKQPYELAGETIHILPHTPEELRLHNMNREIGGGVEIVPVQGDSIQIEELMMLVAKDSIRFTATDERTAGLNKTYIRGLNTSTRLSFPIPTSWYTAKGNKALQDSINLFVTEHEFVSKERQMVYRYFEENRWLAEDESKTGTTYITKPGNLSPFDDIFKEEAKRLGWDWQYLAAIAFHESRFRPEVKAWSGATGLMGIMPRTGRAYGASVGELTDPHVSVRIAVSLLLALDKIFRNIEDPAERVKIVLAAYNAGHGHVVDAQRLAEKYNEDKHSWDSGVRKYILLKSNPEYYNDPVCKNGYLRGRETANYVTNVVEKYELFRRNYQ
ncbi:MltF family protein [Porphyromonas canoris]|uniref:transglycosylase SLT domain-containing protein n=1 Tax=Porphyromonas canoris TaxID=36875 RepID=UPI000B2F7D86|nr:transglycosylase SLT domain-containing protein [Porphyromonas canoris]